jgi:hypothetical protein
METKVVVNKSVTIVSVATVGRGPVSVAKAVSSVTVLSPNSIKIVVVNVQNQVTTVIPNTSLKVVVDSTVKEVITIATGPAGVGVPPGGVAGQQLAKIDGTSYNTKWFDLIANCASALEESAAFASGSKIVIRTDLL